MYVYNYYIRRMIRIKLILRRTQKNSGNGHYCQQALLLPLRVGAPAESRCPRKMISHGQTTTVDDINPALP